MPISYEADHHPAQADLVALYDAVGWRVYTADPERLAQAVASSAWVSTAWEGEQLVGLVRVISDDTTSAYLQDILVHPDHHRRGIGRALMQAALERFDHVRQMVLLTDDRPEQLAFYRSLGLSRIADLVDMPMNAFVRVKGVTLS